MVEFETKEVLRKLRGVTSPRLLPLVFFVRLFNFNETSLTFKSYTKEGVRGLQTKSRLLIRCNIGNSYTQVSSLGLPILGQR